jgi:hypothetical protein
MKHPLVESVSSRIVISTHPGLISGLSLRRSTPTANVRWSSEHSGTYTKRFAGCRTATGHGSSAYTSRTALLTKKNAVRSTNTWLPSVRHGAVKCGLGVRRNFLPPDASPPRCAQLMGLASRGCLVLVLGATAERRNLFFRSDLGLPWIRTLGLPRLSR